MIKPKYYFSVIIPTLNEEHYLPLLLSDLGAQSYRDFEVVVVDGESKDNTVKLAKKAKNLPHISILTSHKRHVCTQRNLGASHAKGEYLIFMDADNRLPSYFLQGIKYQLEANPSELATTYIASQDQSDLAIVSAINTAYELSKKLEAPVFLEAMIIIKQTLFQKVGGFDEHINFAEGANLINAARKLDVSHTVYHDPRYTYSLRRLRKFGLLKLTRAIATHQLSIFLGEQAPQSKLKKLYPMQGGTLFTTKNQSKNKKFTKAIDKLLKNIEIGNKPLTVKSIKKQLSTLLQ